MLVPFLKADAKQLNKESDLIDAGRLFLDKLSFDSWYGEKIEPKTQLIFVDFQNKKVISRININNEKEAA